MTSGKNLVQAVNFMDTFFKDVSKLLQAVNGGMEELGLTSLWGNYAYFNSSASIAGPSGWMPHAFSRWYVPPGTTKDSWVRFIYFNIYLTPKALDEPVAVWGSVSRSDLRGDPWPAWRSLALSNTGPGFIKEPSVSPFRSVASLPAIIGEMSYAVHPLFELNDEQAIDRLLIASLRQEATNVLNSGNTGVSDPQQTFESP